MKGVTIFFAGILVLGVLSYFGLLAVNEHIDRESGAIVEQTLSDNTVNQLMVMSEIQSQIEAGNIQQASEKLAESINTLKKNTRLPLDSFSATSLLQSCRLTKR